MEITEKEKIEVLEIVEGLVSNRTVGSINVLYTRLKDLGFPTLRHALKTTETTLYKFGEKEMENEWSEETKRKLKFLKETAIHKKLVELSLDKDFEVRTGLNEAFGYQQVKLVYRLKRREDVFIYVDAYAQDDGGPEYVVLDINAHLVDAMKSCCNPSKIVSVKYIYPDKQDKIESYLSWLETTLTSTPFPE